MRMEKKSLVLALSLLSVLMNFTEGAPATAPDGNHVKSRWGYKIKPVEGLKHGCFGSSWPTMPFDPDQQAGQFLCVCPFDCQYWKFGEHVSEPRCVGEERDGCEIFMWWRIGGEYTAPFPYDPNNDCQPALRYEDALCKEGCEQCAEGVKPWKKGQKKTEYAPAGEEKKPEGGAKKPEGGEKKQEGGDTKQGGEKKQEGGEKKQEGGEKKQEGGEKKQEEGEKKQEGGEKKQEEGEKKQEGGEKKQDGGKKQEGGENKQEKEWKGEGNKQEGQAGTKQEGKK
eukprot:Nk52_evm14s159 gene=Nk52_evmTU14s159